MNKEKRIAHILANHSSHMSNLSCIAPLYQSGHEKYKHIPEHVIKSIKDIVDMYKELHDELNPMTQTIG
jgi:hypothetical protein